MPRLKIDPKTEPAIIVSNRSISEIKTGAWRNIRPEIDQGSCTKCMICWKFCPEACVTIDSGTPVIEMDYCKGCSICADVCPVDCIVMVDEGE